MSYIGEKIKFYRNYRNMTQKELGEKAGFSRNSADVRIAQYETGKRTPKGDVIPAIANALSISPLALTTPDTSSYYGLMHTFFELEDKYGLRVTKIDGRFYLRFANTSPDAETITTDLETWYEEYSKFQDDDITLENYNEWRYRFPEIRAEHQKKDRDEARNLYNENV